MRLMTVIADTESLKAELVTGDRVNFVHCGDRPVPYVAAKEYGTIWLIGYMLQWKVEHRMYVYSY